MQYADLSGIAFIEALASTKPVPGGGGASALVGAIGTALGNMAGSISQPRKKDPADQERLAALAAQATQLQQTLLTLIDRDAQVFEPLSQAYRMPKDTPEQQAEKAKVMEAALLDACQVPLEIMEACCAAINLHREFAQLSTALVISDVGAGAACCRAALAAASLNVYINTSSMKDRQTAQALAKKANQMLDSYLPLAEEIYTGVLARLRSTD